MDTIPKLLLHQAEVRGGRPALRMKKFGIWQAETWRDVAHKVRRVAGGLLDMNVSKGELVVIIGHNTPDIYNAISACQAVGAIAVPIYGVPPNDSFAYIMGIVGARIAIVQDQQQVDALLEIKDLKTPLQAIFYTVGRGIDESYDSNIVRSYDSLCRQGDEYLAKHPSFFEDKINEGKEDDIALIIFNSGIDRPSKMAQLSYKNFISLAKYVVEQDQINDTDEMLSFMPISLSPNLLCGYIMSHVAGFCISCPESTETVMEDLREITPSILYAPPYAYKQIATSMQERIGTKPSLSKWMYEKYVSHPAEMGMDKHSIVGELFVTSPIRNLYGLGRLRLGFTGGDSIHNATFNFFQVLGIELKQIYGTAESAGCISMQIEERSADNVGHPAKGVEIKISDNGEILCRGDNIFCGYYQDEAATKATFNDEGWYCTGDVGAINPDGTLHLYDKLSACITLKDGVTCLPRVIENTIKASSYIHEAFVSDIDGEKLFAAVCIERITVGHWADSNGVRYTSYADLASKEEVRQLISKVIAEANRQTAEQKQPAINQFLMMHRAFSPNSGELTWTNKLRRTYLKDCFANFGPALEKRQENVEIKDDLQDRSVELKILQC